MEKLAAVLCIALLAVAAREADATPLTKIALLKKLLQPKVAPPTYKKLGYTADGKKVMAAIPTPPAPSKHALLESLLKKKNDLLSSVLDTKTGLVDHVTDTKTGLLHKGYGAAQDLKTTAAGAVKTKTGLLTGALDKLLAAKSPPMTYPQQGYGR